MIVSYKNDQGLKPKIEVIETLDGKIRCSLELENNYSV
jgi:hypothetical protein